MQQLHKVLNLSVPERQLLIHTFVLLGTIRLGLWLLSFQTLQNLLERASQKPRKLALSEPLPIGKITEAVHRSCRYMPGQVKCLAQALTTQVLMKQHGYPSELRIGVTKGESGKLEAHAWIESQGKVVIGHLRDLPRYIPMSSLDRG
jgi:Transglutaminase-like superfamily